MLRFNDDRDWFFEKRFGMFVHWGIYAIPAYHEQVLWRTDITRTEYEKLIHDFNPIKFDPEEWLDVMQDAGMEYLCFTTKHHDGFCMWETKYTDYNVMNTPYKKDILGMLAEACHRRGIYLGLYYSLPDWHHPNCPNWNRHHEMFGPRPGDDPDEQKYLEFVRNQVKELCTNYGAIHEFFWDINVAEYKDPSFNEMIRELQPAAVINNRGPDPGDYSTPERHVPEGLEFSSPTEANNSLGRESWGYRIDEDYYTAKFLMQSMDKIMAMGGNYLLNVGPKADGTFPEECVQTLGRIGKWYGKIRESIEGVRPCSYMLDSRPRGTYPDDVLLTRRDNTIYVHAYRDLNTTAIVLDCLATKPQKAVLLNNGRELDTVVDTVPWRWSIGPCLRIRGLPVNEILDEVLVVKLEYGDTFD